MDASARLRRAQELVEEKQYENALNEYVWFHEHALEEGPSQYGVRLSYALRFWRELGEVYPPALAKLKEVVDYKSLELENGRADAELFHDVVAINNVLGNQDATYRLFVSINNKYPDFAASCARVATDSIIGAKDFKLARSFIKEPIEAIEKLTKLLNKDIKWASSDEKLKHSDAIRDALIHNYIHEVLSLATIVSSAGEAELSGRMISIAISQVQESEVQAIIKNGLVDSVMDEVVRAAES